MPYASISDYSIIGDCHTAALVSREGSIDWCCLPHFDSNAVFCRILDDSRGGYFSVRPAGPFRASREYELDSNVLATTFEAPVGAIRVTDCMPIEHAGGDRRGRDVRTRHEILRTVEGLGGRVRVRVEFKPTFDFAAVPTTIERTLASGSRLTCRTGPGASSPASVRNDSRSLGSACTGAARECARQ